MVLVAILTMGSVALVFAVILALADIRLKVVIDPKIEAINAILPQANCGACGFPGCMGYATAIVESGAQVNRCAPGGRMATEHIAAIMGVESGPQVRKVARVLCRGTSTAAQRKAHYKGIPECRAAVLVSSGDKRCFWGCLGYGDCQRVCPFGAITMNADGLPQVDEKKCTACGICVRECPKHILALVPEAQTVLVFCRSQDSPKKSRMVCTNACIGCGICVRGCASGAVSLHNNLAVVTAPEKWDDDCFAGTATCPTGAINRIHSDRPSAITE
jgi:Na+-translocating ferredoxin:NAD+ oxidoreductase subunit B